MSRKETKERNKGIIRVAAQPNKEMKVAAKIGNAVAKKFPKHKMFVREYAISGDNKVVEIALRPTGHANSMRDEISVSYAAEFFIEADKATIKGKAKAIYDDFLTMFEQ